MNISTNNKQLKRKIVRGQHVKNIRRAVVKINRLLVHGISFPI
jgi:hypothetical protein